MKVSFLNAKHRWWVKNGHFQKLKKATGTQRHWDFSIRPSFAHAEGHPQKAPNDRHCFAVAQGFLQTHMFHFSFLPSLPKTLVSIFLPTSYAKMANLYSLLNFWTIMFQLKLAARMFILVYFCCHLAEWSPACPPHTGNHCRVSESITTWVYLTPTDCDLNSLGVAWAFKFFKDPQVTLICRQIQEHH